MAWTTPAAGGIITSANSLILYSMSEARVGSASNSSIGTYGAATAYTEHNTPLVAFIDDLNDNGTVQLRFITMANVTALGACTSLTLRQYLNILGSAGATGSAGTNVEAYAHTALTTGGGTLTVAWKFWDSGWVNVASLVTNMSTYGLTIANPVYRFDTVGGNPTIGRTATTVFVRVA